MKLREHYFTLYHQFYPIANVFIVYIASVLDCSERHAKSIIKRLAENNWVEWTPSLGRGRASKIRFLLSEEAFKETHIKNLIKNGEISRALEEIEETPLKQSFLQWLQNQFLWTPGYANDSGLDVLSYPYYFPVNTFNPLYALTRHEGHVISHLFNKLLRYSYNDNKFELELLHSYENIDSGRKWRFFIRKGVYFHDGSKLTVHTIKENIALWQESFSNKWKKTMLNQIEAISLDSNYIITFHLSGPNQLFLHLFTDNQASIIPIHLYKQDPDRFNQFPIGTGPYKVVNHKENYLRLEAFDHYFGYRPQIDQINLYKLPTNKQLPFKGVNYQVRQQDTNKTVLYDFPQTDRGGTFLVVNRNKPGLHTLKDFPQMLSKALDRHKLFTNHPHYQVWHPDGFFVRDGTPLRQTYEPAIARKWFVENGFIGHTLTLKSTCLRHNAHLGYELDILKETLTDFGLKINTEIVDYEELTSPEKLNESDLIIAGVALADDILSSLINTFSSKLNFIYTTIPDEVRSHVDHVVERILISDSTDTAYKRLRELESFLLNDYHIIYLYERISNVTIEADERLKGIEVNRYNRLKYDRLWYAL